MVIKVGIVGCSSENGHPFSFSAIINGYEKSAFEKTGWTVILDYLERQKKEAFGIPEMKITHAWTQDISMTRQLCEACYISTPLSSLDEMIDEVDAVIIARDDYETHLELAKRFLEAGRILFVDKPLALKEEELNYFKTYLLNGKLMSTSGLRYSIELARVKEDLNKIGELLLIQAAVINDSVKYGIHILDAIANLNMGKIKTMTRLYSNFEAYSFQLDTGVLFNLFCLGQVKKIFHCSFYGTKGNIDCHLMDNFSAFKHTLMHFKKMIIDNQPPFDPQELLLNMKILQYTKILAKGETVEFEA